MSDRTQQLDATDHAPDGAQGVQPRLLRLFSTLRIWAYGHWLRSVVVAGIMLSLIAITMAGWAYLADIALRTGELTIDEAFQILDEGRQDEVRLAVARMLKSGRLQRNEYGGPLMVLGAVKIKDAEIEPTADRRRIEFLVASRYLQEARAYGMPESRAAEGLFMLGRSLVESGQFDEGLQVLDELLAELAATDESLALDAERFLADTCLHLPNPEFERALKHNQKVLASPKLAGHERAAALLQQTECLSGLDRFDEARQVLATIVPGEIPTPILQFVTGKMLLDRVERASRDAAKNAASHATGASRDMLAEALQLLLKATEQDRQKGSVTRQASYQIGRAHELQGRREMALKQYARTRQLYSESFEGLAAALAEADLLRQQGDFDGALIGYRRTMDAFRAVPVYRSVTLPIGQIRERLMTALKEFVERRRFTEALALIEYSQPPFSRTEMLELRGATLERWGDLLLSDATGDAARGDANRSAGLHKLRAAGVAYEQLAEQHFASRAYTADLWHSAEDYFAGHSFTSTIRLLNQYLDNEPELRNAQALLRLGQAHLAVRQIPESISAFEECIEFHPLDSSTYQARIDCAKAYWHQGDTSRAEQLLRDNIVGSSLQPASREWKDSLFELGMLLHETGQYELAISTLEEAIERYPRDPQRLAAQYVVGESYRRWAQEMLGLSGQARTASERDKHRQEANERLTTALKHFEEVQVSITLKAHDLHGDPLLGTMLRNCYMLEGTVLFDLERFKEAIEAFSNVASLYPDNPFVLETFVQIANCWRRLGQDAKARGAIQQAQIVLQGLPPESDFASATALNREEWSMLLADMSKW